MKGLHVNKEILNSWRRCLDAGVVSAAACPDSCIEDSELEIKLRKNKMMVSVFKEVIKKLPIQVAKDHYFILTDHTGFLLCIENKSAPAFLKEGIFLTEEISGTNAIALAIKLKRNVYTMPQHHFCMFLKEIHFFATPLIYKQKMLGVLAIAAVGQPIKKEWFVITDLLKYRMLNEIEYAKKLGHIRAGDKIRLNDKQLEVLKLLAKGLTETAVAIELKISVHTVRYHKKVIFEKLGTGSIVDAIVKALKLDLISIDDI